MPTYENEREGRRMTVSGAAAEAQYDADPSWRLVAEEKPPTPKQRIQQDAAALGLSGDGTVDEITARIDVHVADLLKQAGELGIDANELTAVDLAAAIEAKLAE